jgi:ATP-dependent DNA helicase RecQ
VVEALLAGRDCLAVLPTGGRQIASATSCPPWCASGLVLVISPLVALMQDQVLPAADAAASPPPACTGA